MSKIINFKVREYQSHESDFEFNDLSFVNIDRYQELLDVIRRDSNNYFLKEIYNQDYFKQNNIVIIKKWESSGSNRLIVKSLELDNGILSINIDRIVSQIGTMDMRFWFIVIEYPKQSITVDDIYVNFITKRI